MQIHFALKKGIIFEEAYNNLEGIIYPLISSMTNKNRLRIYIADDDLEDREIFKITIAKTDIQSDIIEFGNGEDLIDLVGTIVPDVLFLDINMPKLDGLKCLKVLRDDPRLRKLPIIMYSTSDHQNEVDAAHAGGASAFVKKKSLIEEQVSTFKKVLSHDWKSSAKPARREDFLVL